MNLFLSLFLFGCQGLNKDRKEITHDSEISKITECESYYDSLLERTIYRRVDIMPQYNGGIPAFHQYFMKEFSYPKGYDQIQASVNLTFIVEASGTITTIGIYKKDISQQSPVDIEAIRVLESAPKWIAGECKGKKVPVSYSLPIRF